MDHVVVVGSGASGVHFALSLLERGHRVTMVDGGKRGPVPPHPDATYTQLKERLDDPARYLLGEDFGGVVLPDSGEEYYGVPPEKGFIFEHPDGFAPRSHGFSPLFSFAQGGLAEAWTAGCYPLNADEIEDFPFAHSALQRGYETVARRIGVTGEDDDLARFMPLHEGLMAPLRLDAHSELLLDRYAKKRSWLNARLRCYLGRTRVATLSRDLGDRKACAYLGRCLWGCPIGALYTPSATLRECMGHPNFDYAGGLFASHFALGAEGRATELVARSIDGTEERRFGIDVLALAAGTLCSSGIVLESLRRDGAGDVALEGLMDNRQVLVPFVNQRMLGRAFEDEAYQYHLIGLGIEGETPRDYVHGQITTLKTAMMHPVVQSLPFDLGTSALIGRATHAALGVVNVNFNDHRRPGNSVGLSGEDPGNLVVRYAPASGEGDRLKRTLKTVSRALRKLGCWVPPGMSHVRPMGASVHYAGTLPMCENGGAWTTDPQGRSRDLPNVFLVDGCGFPFLPAKNITFTLMANAVRIADSAF
ncbi:MAG: hypothetical protein GTO30_13710 [Acidobacteria bacterium]|nr:hypothetical protein [Acidobacteriota bacterium]NIM62649.1 hypothetical protein [Acidobacteriota bacterium]NIO59889.1 hypothetical protein [Acidobacteriota bacterium]NIQ86063.1 hypothetical protein [Acidobacteriota bacterium]NIT11579.1 hypothetical protein [Acidobacteriota bacterium]